MTYCAGGAATGVSETKVNLAQLSAFKINQVMTSVISFLIIWCFSYLENLFIFIREMK